MTQQRQLRGKVSKQLSVSLACTAEELEPADLVIANNVLAHVPDINDFVAGIARLLKPYGKLHKFPHLLRLLAGNQFDTIYHEHFSYLSLRVVQRIAAQSACKLWMWAFQLMEVALGVASSQNAVDVSLAVEKVLAEESFAGLETLAAYAGFQQRAEDAKNGLLEYLLKSKRQGRRVLGYGAAAKETLF